MKGSSNFKSKEELLPSQRTKWQETAKKRLAKTGSGPDSEKYAKHITKAAMQRKLRSKNDKSIEGLK